MFGAGCGSEDETTTQTSDGTTTQSQNGSDPATPGVHDERESIEDAAKRLEAAVGDEDCDAINEFVLIAREDTHATKENCKQVAKILGDATLEGSESFDGAGIIDFARGDRTVAALMVVDRDGRYKLVQLNGLTGLPSVGTELADGFDEAANDLVKAVADQDCEAFRELSNYHIGPGSARLSDKQVCAYVKDGPLGIVTAEEPKVKPKPLGGNAEYAFYGVGSDTLFVTMVMTRQTSEGLPETQPELPDDAAEYVFINAIPTDSAPAD